MVPRSMILIGGCEIAANAFIYNHLSRETNFKRYSPNYGVLLNNLTLIYKLNFGYWVLFSLVIWGYDDRSAVTQYFRYAAH